MTKGVRVVFIKKKQLLPLTLLLLASSVEVQAGPRDQAKKLYSSLTGNTANKAIADKYEKMVKDGKIKAAAKEIVESNQGFYNVTLKNFFTPMSNEDGTQFAPLNDMTATLIGVTRDEIDFFRVFWDNILYQFDGQLITNSASGIPSKFDKYKATNDRLYLSKYDAAIPIYNRTKNNMYEEAEKMNISYSDTSALVQTQQNTYTTRNEAAIAGIFSTRGWAKAYYEAGTNRASFAYFAKNFLCLEMEELNDTTIPDFRVRRDVDRAPGGKTETYKTFCVGCHAGQDALGGAFVYYDFTSGAMRYAEHEDVDENGDIVSVGPVAPKINKNNMFPDGKITISDSWINLWNEGQNAYIGWGETTSGNGAKSLGKMFAETKQVRSCLAKQVFESVCYRTPSSEEDKRTVEVLAEEFDKDGNMKNLFINAALTCIGD
jgi:hypothetical protein